jgi:hypothetical protein
MYSNVQMNILKEKYFIPEKEIRYFSGILMLIGK